MCLCVCHYECRVKRGNLSGDLYHLISVDAQLHIGAYTVQGIAMYRTVLRYDEYYI